MFKSSLLSLLILTSCHTRSAMQAADEHANVAPTSPTLPAPTPAPAATSGIDVADGTAIYMANYEVHVTTLLGIEICSGLATLRLNVAFGKDTHILDIPVGKVHCLGGAVGDIDIAAAFNGPQVGPDKTEMFVKDDIMTFKGYGTHVYNEPYRPLFPSFIAAPRASLMTLSKEVKVTGKDVVTHQPIAGTVSVKTLKYGEIFKSTDGKMTFNDTIRFETKNTGFENVDKIDSFLFDRFEILVNFNPLAAPEIVLETTMQDLNAVMPSTDTGTGTGTTTTTATGSGTATGTATATGTSLSDKAQKLMKVKITARIISMEGQKH